MVRLVGALLAIGSLAAPAVAVAGGPAVHSLEVAARMAPADGGAAIELANAYWREGRTAQAYGAYRRALALDDVMLETPGGDAISSHEVASRVLAQQVALSGR